MSRRQGRTSLLLGLVVLVALACLVRDASGHRNHPRKEEHGKAERHRGKHAHAKTADTDGEGMEHRFPDPKTEVKEDREIKKEEADAKKSVKDVDNEGLGSDKSDGGDKSGRKKDDIADSNDDSKKDGSEKGGHNDSSAADERKGDGVSSRKKDDDDVDSKPRSGNDDTPSGPVNPSSSCGDIYKELPQPESDFSRCEKGWKEALDRANGPDASKNSWWRLGKASGYVTALRSAVPTVDSCKSLAEVLELTVSRRKYDLPTEAILDDAGMKEFKKGLKEGFVEQCTHGAKKGASDRAHCYGFSQGYMSAVEKLMTPSRSDDPCDFVFSKSDPNNGVCVRAFSSGSLQETQHEKSSGKSSHKWWREGFLKGFRNSVWGKLSKACVLEAKESAKRVSRSLYELPASTNMLSEQDMNHFKEGVQRGLELECRWEGESGTEKGTYAFRFGFYRGYLKSIKS